MRKNWGIASRKHSTTEIKWAGLVAKAIQAKLKTAVYVVLYTDPDGFPTIELRTADKSKTYHAGYFGSLADPEIRKVRPALILKDMAKK